MNRHERRSLKHMAQNLQPIATPINIKYGTDGTNVVMSFSQPVTNNTMSLEQTRTMIKCLQEAVEYVEKMKPQ
jgi:trehalose-6-phosphate synthase